MGNGIIIQVVLPLALFTIMFGVGMSLKLGEFKLFWQQPSVVLFGVALQLLLLPLLGIFVVYLFQLPAALSVGIMVLTFAPGGATSNMITYLARGDTALSVCLTAVSGLITPLTMPILTVAAISFWMGEKAAFDFPIIETMLKLLVISVLPAILGATVQHYWPFFCRKSERYIKILACTFLILVVVGIVKANWDKLPELTGQLGPAVLVLVSLAMLSGFMLARKLRLNSEQGVTLAVEVGIQNAATALLITGGILQNSEMAASALIYGVLMNIPAFGLIAYRSFKPKTLYSDSI